MSLLELKAAAAAVEIEHRDAADSNGAADSPRDKDVTELTTPN